MDDELQSILDTLAVLQNPNSSAIQLYRAKFATPETLEQARFWVQRELDDIQTGFASTDEVVRVLAGLIEKIVVGIGTEAEDGGLQGPEGPQGPQGPPGEGSGSNVYTQVQQPSGSEGDIWLKVRG